MHQLQAALGFACACLAIVQVSPNQNEVKQIESKRNKFKLSQAEHLDFIRRSKPTFKNKTLVISIVVREPFVIFNTPPDWPSKSALDRQRARKNLANYSGVAIELVRRLMAIFKFETRLTWPNDNQFGIFVPTNQSWTGLMGQLARGEVDLGVTALSLTLSRGLYWLHKKIE